MKSIHHMPSKKEQLHFDLFNAAGDGDLERVRLLLAAGASLQFVVEDEYTETPLHEAVYYGHLSVVQFILETEEIADEEFDGYINAPSEIGTPLAVAVANRSKPMCKLLLNAGADPLALDLADRTALHAAVEAGDMRLMRLLMDALEESGQLCCEPSGLDPSYYGGSPLHLAASMRSLKMTECLLDAGANPNAVDLGCQTPLHLAMQPWKALPQHLRKTSPWNSQVAIVRNLLEAGADPNVKDSDGKTPLDIAVKSKLPRVRDLLVKHGGVESKTPSLERRPRMPSRTTRSFKKTR